MRALLLSAFAVAALTGCGFKSDELTRGEAKRLLQEAVPSEAPIQLALCPESIDLGLALGLWDSERRPTKDGAELLEPYFKSFGGWWGTPQHPHKYKIGEVTGISRPTDESTTARVEYTWSYADLPDAVRFMVASEFTAEAYFNLYDDGWRVDASDLNWEPYANKSAGCDQRDGQLPGAEAERLQAIREARLAEEEKARQAEAQRIQAIVARFRDNGDGTISDQQTGLMWIQKSSSFKTFDRAEAHCAASNFAGFEDWRLPTRADFEPLVDPTGRALIDTPDRLFFGALSKAAANSTRFGICLGGDPGKIYGWRPKYGFTTCSKSGFTASYTCVRDSG